MTAPSTFMKLGAGTLAAGFLFISFTRNEPTVPTAAPPATDAFAFVRSMEGTVPDGDIKQASDGALVVDAELGHLFDYYLAGLGEKDLGAIRAEIERELDRRLKPGAAAEAKLLLGRYLDYKRALVGLELQLPPETDLLKAARARLAATQGIRARFFSPSESAGLFGFSDAYDRDALARLEISQDAKLSMAQRSEQLALLDRKLSPAMREAREAPVRVIRTEEKVAAMRAQGATDDDVYRLRAAAFSPEGAARLAQLDQEEAAWKARIATYLAQRAALPPGSESQLQQLRNQYFTQDEQRRLGAYEDPR
ncbi:lipase chaperone [Massilia sp. PAMC28688]|uniref:lipase secretion chaperone n=1 Tax=Massilia sp. PAMC28688 TaxID=2861283 RepID=UPI001C626BD8|nr:lipase secretion chaperone [Massilia sp. PAMC28688]QYF95374.1 lipase chaperone [Massilia sp. PAMC28688]